MIQSVLLVYSSASGLSFSLAPGKVLTDTYTPSSHYNSSARSPAQQLGRSFCQKSYAAKIQHCVDRLILRANKHIVPCLGANHCQSGRRDYIPLQWETVSRDKRHGRDRLDCCEDVLLPKLARSSQQYPIFATSTGIYADAPKRTTQQRVKKTNEVAHTIRLDAHRPSLAIVSCSRYQ